MPGIAIRLGIDEQAFVGSSLYIFAQVLQRYFALNSQLNCFSQLTLLSQRSGEELIRCPERSADATPASIQQLLDAPQRFECFQALRLLLAWLAEHDIDEHTALAKIMRFDNSVSLRFPASQIEALATNGIADADALLQALLSGHSQHIHLTPAFMGLLGCQGSLPSHYSERIAAHQHGERDTSARAFLDLFSSRAVTLFYQAWQKIPHRAGRPQRRLPVAPAGPGRVPAGPGRGAGAGPGGDRPVLRLAAAT